MKVKELPIDDRPREKLMLRGVQSLSNTELIAILLRTGTKGKSVIQISQELLQKYNNLNILTNQTHAALKKIPGIGNDKATALIAAFELSRRVDSQKKWLSNKKVTSPQNIADFFIPLLRDEVKEKFFAICLNSANKIITYELISVGTLNSSLVHPREVFKVAVENNSASIILLHNHPSGNGDPSNEDIMLTKKMIEVGKFMDIPIFDHLIIAGDNYTSMVEMRII